MKRIVLFAILLIALLAPRDTDAQSSGVTSIRSGDWNALLDMTPSKAACDVADRANTDAKSPGKRRGAFTKCMALTDLNNLGFYQLGLRVLGAICALKLVSTLCGHVKCIVADSTKKQMIRIATGGIVAFVANKQASWDGAKVKLVTETRCDDHFSLNPKMTIAVAACAALPGPTLIGSAFVNSVPETLFCRNAAIVFVNKSFRLSFGPPTLFVCVLSDWRAQSAPTFAKFDWRGRNGLCSIVPIDIAQWLAFDPPVLFMIGWSKACFLSTTALTVTARDFIRGIIGAHQNLQFWCQGRGRSLRRSAISIGVLPEYFSTKKLFLQQLGLRAAI